MKKIYCFVIIFFLLCLGMLTFIQDNQNANESKSSVPRIIQKGEINFEFLDDTEQYIIKNFGFRNELLSLYTTVQEKVFKNSTVNNVIVGEDGFLYLGETAEDYMGTRKITERELFQTQKIISLISEYVERNGGDFVLVVAPNKNSVYDKMPYNYIKTNTESISDKLFSVLKNEEYVNLFEVFSGEEIMYYKTDSHWNEQGARQAYIAVMEHIGKEYDDFSDCLVKEVKIKGDLYQMLYPKRDANEMSYPYQKEKEYTFLTKTRSTEEVFFITENKNKEDSLLMFRDSFANNLVSFFSNNFATAVYDKNICYDLFQMEEYKSNYVIIEIAERNVNTIQSKLPMFMAPERECYLEGDEQNIVKEFETEEIDNHVWIQGILDENYLENNSLLYLENEEIIYELTPQLIDGEYGFCGCVPEKLDNAKIWISGTENYWDLLEE